MLEYKINMKPGKIVYQGKSKSGQQLIFRYPTKDDLTAVWKYINTLSKEQTFLILQGKKISLKEEKKWLEDNLKKIHQGKAVQLFVFVDNELVGVSDIIVKEDAERHIGGFGITIAKDFRNKGIGTLLMETIFKEAKKNCNDLKIVTLGVFGNNSVAKKLYKKMGFLEFGNLPQGLLHQGKPVNHIYMYKNM